MDVRADVNIFDICKENSDDALKNMRSVASKLFGGRTDIVIGVNGSVARREYTSKSDIDLFVLSTRQDAIDVNKVEEDFRAALSKQELKLPSEDGVFEGVLPTEQLLGPIGGDDDINQTLTRRMLFLLEGEWIFNQPDFEELRERLIERYVRDDLEDDKLALYLLNDIIRYWRTICVDFELKTSEGDKPRAIRLAKLRISRMLLCFAGFVAVAEANELPVNEKRARLVELFSMQGIERLEKTLGSKFFKAKECYGSFLSRLDDPDFRSKLELEGVQGMRTEEYLYMVDLARQFKAELVGILLEHYGHESPVVRSILL